MAEAAWRQGGLERVDLVVSRQPLGKSPAAPTLEHRLQVLSDVASSRPWLGVAVSDGRLIADVCLGYDAVVMGHDKWLQVVDPSWYGGSEAARDRAVAALPPVLLALRSGAGPPGPLPPSVTVLDVHPVHGPVSSTLVRGGRLEWMLPEAARFDAGTGAWSDPDRYHRWRASPD